MTDELSLSEPEPDRTTPPTPAQLLADCVQLLATLDIKDDRDVKSICVALNRLKVRDAARLTAGTWPRLTAQHKGQWIKWLWDMKDVDQIVSGEMRLAKLLLTKDQERAAFLLNRATRRVLGESGPSRNRCLDQVRNIWLSSSSEERPLPVRVITWDILASMPSGGAGGFVEAVIDAASLEGSKGQENHDRRPQVAEWIHNLIAHETMPAAEREVLLRLASQGGRKQAKPTPPEGSEREGAGNSGGAGTSFTPAKADHSKTREPRHLIREMSDHLRLLTEAVSNLGQRRLCDGAELDTSQENLKKALLRAADAEQARLRTEQRAEVAERGRSQAIAERDNLATANDALEQKLRDAARMAETLEKRVVDAEIQLAALKTASTAKIEALQVQVELARTQVVQAQEAGKRQVREVLTEAMHPHLENYREVGNQPRTAEQAEFLIRLLGSVFQTMRNNQVQIRE